MASRAIVFVLNLLQDVNIVRPLVYVAARETDADIVFLISARFLERDRGKIWQREIGQMCADTSAGFFIYETPLDAFAVLQCRRGLLIAASESNLSAHADTHNVFRIAPSSFLKITLQHGYECVGFLQNREHINAHGRNITFAADVVCGWLEASALTALAPSERPKLYVSGPPSVLQAPVRGPDHPPVAGGMVCENLHSVRMKASAEVLPTFMETFFQMCQTLFDYGRGITLRPHPGGQYVLKNNVTLPANVTLNNLPFYRVDLASYDFGISAPSTVVIDMLLAGIPTAVWVDAFGAVDASNYDGLTQVTQLADWLAFARDAVLRRDAVLARQSEFLDQLKMPRDPKDVYRRFATLLANGNDLLSNVTSPAVDRHHGVRPSTSINVKSAPRKITLIANGFLPTLQLSFLKPLAPDIRNGAIEYTLITEEQLVAEFGPQKNSVEAGDWLTSQIQKSEPDLIVCCRYSGPHAQNIIDFARRAHIPAIYHIDDDLLHIPRELGEKKFRAHNHPNRLFTVNLLLEESDLVYASTTELKRRFRKLGFRTPIVAGPIYSSASILSHVTERPVTKIGYMGFDHAHDFELVLPALIQFLESHSTVSFQLFGSIPMPDVLSAFGDRVSVIEPVRNYENFMARFAELGWDIGICPLAQTPFNIVKANTKWVEYTSVGAAVVASRDMIYDSCTANGCGMTVGPDGWFQALDFLATHPVERAEMVRRAQNRVQEDFSEAKLRLQVLRVFECAETLVNEKHGKRMAPVAGAPVPGTYLVEPERQDIHWPHLPPGVLSASAARLVHRPAPDPITVTSQ